MNILGVGGHSKVVIDAALKSGREITAVFDDDPRKHGKKFCGYVVEGSIDSSIAGQAVAAIGSNKSRNNISNRLTSCRWQTIIHPDTIIADNVTIGEGSVIMAGAVIQPGVAIGRHVIINTGACIDHDCKIADFAHIAPNCSLAGGVKIGKGAFIGIGASVIQYKKIGEWVTIGAGAVVAEDISPNCTAVGIPAKPIKFHDE